jgi:hypothetical protein
VDAMGQASDPVPLADWLFVCDGLKGEASQKMGDEQFYFDLGEVDADTDT